MKEVHNFQNQTCSILGTASFSFVKKNKFHRTVFKVLHTPAISLLWPSQWSVDHQRTEQSQIISPLLKSKIWSVRFIWWRVPVNGITNTGKWYYQYKYEPLGIWSYRNDTDCTYYDYFVYNYILFNQIIQLNLPTNFWI